MERMLQMIQEITAYMQYLSLRQNLQVCVCDLHAFPSAFIERLTPFHGHVNGFCQAIKNSRGNRGCLLMQKFVRKKARENTPFLGRCYAGASEAVFPILYDEEYIGFLCVACENEHTMYEMRPMITPLVHSFQLLYLQLKKTPIEKKDLQKRIYEELLRFVTENYTQRLTTENIAASLHYSSSYLSHIFQQQKGMSLMRYIRLLKLQHAKKLLVFSHKSITEIASLLNFDTPNYFSAVFKKEYGVSPREYRKQKALLS